MKDQLNTSPSCIELLTRIAECGTEITVAAKAAAVDYGEKASLLDDKIAIISDNIRKAKIWYDELFR